MTPDPLLQRSLAKAPPLVRLTADTVPARRREFAEQLLDSRQPDQPSVATEDRLITGTDGQPMGVRIYRNRDVASAAPVPAVVWFHGGAFVMGTLDSEDVSCQLVCQQLGAVVVAAEYRLAPEHPFPAGAEDCFRSLCWTVEHGDELGIDPARVAVGGSSAGGGLAASVALMARDRGGPPLAYQFLGIPMLDDRCDTTSMGQHTDPRIWNGDLCRDSWLLYLGADHGEVSPYAAPARATDLSGLPPAYVLVNEVDPLADEDVDYARRLSYAGVPTEVHVVPGAWHGFAFYLPRLPLARRMNERWIEAMGAALGVERRP